MRRILSFFVGLLFPLVTFPQPIVQETTLAANKDQIFVWARIVASRDHITIEAETEPRHDELRFSVDSIDPLEAKRHFEQMENVTELEAFHHRVIFAVYPLSKLKAISFQANDENGPLGVTLVPNLTACPRIPFETVVSMTATRDRDGDGWRARIVQKEDTCWRFVPDCDDRDLNVHPGQKRHNCE